ncbi:23S rRNA (uracil(1939)-C(5))-methyltransferase RlmD [Tumidithrix elongata RA019]|uniref:23S rRNA (Uracil(1939)-C(5))-methyltransferase RlmD n=1 Tax=Tumidithrix elongata BACA0141 TaxID=2716417 RepID=A0AAW9PY82_9CYAN|nr:23S rRNA (uracil(1939)-C(5))-methyltransferase RlmD [Tumidithrix elongata RA019]
MQQGQTISLEITDLADSGDGVGRHEALVVFVPDTVPGDRIEAKLVKVKHSYANASLTKILAPSPHRIRAACIVADKCGGCQWQVVSYDFQLQIKQNQVAQALQRIGKFDPEAIAGWMDPIIGAPSDLHYRNKVTYPLDKTQEGKVRAGYYQKGSHKLVNLNQCPVQDRRLDLFLENVKLDIQKQGWLIYDEQYHRGLLRHFSLRIGRQTGQVLLTLISTSWDVPGLEEQANAWLEKYPQLVGVMLNHNSIRTNTIFGAETRCIAGRDFVEERFAGLTFQLRADTFFQVYTEQAEAMVSVIQEELGLQGHELLLDAYAGIGTISLPLAQSVKQVIAIEIQPQATQQAILNAQMNGIDNIQFLTGKVEDLLPTLEIQPDITILDPPRKGCEPSAIAHLHSHPSQQIAYVSCNPATLARDLNLLCADNAYRITRIQPFDFFPQTSHVESVTFLTKN